MQIIAVWSFIFCRFFWPKGIELSHPCEWEILSLLRLPLGLAAVLVFYNVQPGTKAQLKN